MQAIAGDGDIGALRRARIAGRRFDEVKGDSVVVLAEPGALPAHVDAVGAEPTRACIEQHTLQIATMKRKLRRRVTGAAAERLAVDELAEPIVEDRLPGLDGDAGQGVLEP